MPDKREPEPEPHPCTVAWNRLADVQDLLNVTQAANAVTVYRQVLHLARWRTAQFARELDALLEELGE